MKMIRPPSDSTGAAARVVATAPMHVDLPLAIEVDRVEIGIVDRLALHGDGRIVDEDVELAEVRRSPCRPAAWPRPCRPGRS